MSGKYWFLLHEGKPCNVVWRDPGIHYHRWSDQHRSWVHDNSLFLEIDGPDARRSQFREVSRNEAIAWLERSTSYEPAVADRAMTVDAEMRAQGPVGRPRASVESASAESASAVLAEVLRSDPKALAFARRHLEELDVVDAGRGKNPWFSGDRQDAEWGVSEFVHRHIDVGDDPAVSLHTERCLREAVVLVDT